MALSQPIATTLATIFLCINEKKYLDKYPIEFKHVFYRRCIEYTFLLFKKDEHIESFLKYMNDQHKNNKFTKEIEQNNSSSFQDIKIIKKITSLKHP